MIPYVIFLTAVAVAYGLITGWAGYEIGYKKGGRDQDRHRHRKGDPQETTPLELPTAGRLEPVPDHEVRQPGYFTLTTPFPERWEFFGHGVEVQPPPGSAEYELLTQTAMCPDCGHENGQCRCGPGPGDLDETPSDFTRRMALDMDEFIRGMVERSNFDQHTMRAD